MAFDIDGAKKAGYSETEIADYLGQQNKFDVAGARKAGYKDTDIISHLSSTPIQPAKRAAASGQEAQTGEAPAGSQGLKRVTGDLSTGRPELDLQIASPETVVPPAAPSLVDRAKEAWQQAMSTITSRTTKSVLDSHVDAPQATEMAPPPTDGLLKPGTIDTTNRKVLNNPDGSISTESSFSIGTDEGEVLLPSVINGKRVSMREAIAHYDATGEHLGIFDTPEHADAYAEALHNQQGNRYGAHEVAAIKVPINPKFREQFNQQWDAASEGERGAMVNQPGVLGELAKERSGVLSQQDKTAVSATDDFDTRVEKRTARLTASGIDPDIAHLAARYGAMVGATPGGEMNAYFGGRYGTITGQPFDEEARKDFEKKSALTRGAAKGALALGQGVTGTLKFVADVAHTKHVSEMLGSASNKLAGIESGIGDPAKDASYLSKTIESATASIGQQLPFMIAGAATGGSSIPLTAIFMTSFGQEYLNGEKAKLSMPQNVTRAATFGTLEVLGERLGLGEKMEAIRAAARGTPINKIGELLWESAKKEVPGEVFTGTGEFAFDRFAPGEMALNPNATFQDYFDMVRDTLATTLTQSVMVGGAIGTVAATRNAIGGTAPGTRTDEINAEAARQTALDNWQNNGLVQPSAATPVATESEIQPGVSTNAQPAPTPTVTAPEAVTPAMAGEAVSASADQATTNSPVTLDRRALADAFTIDDEGTIDAAQATTAVRAQVESALAAGTPVSQGRGKNRVAVSSVDDIDVPAIIAGKSRIQIGGQPVPEKSKGGETNGQEQIQQTGEGEEAVLEPTLAEKVKEAKKGVSIAPTEDGFAVTVDGVKQAEYDTLERAREEKNKIKDALATGTPPVEEQQRIIDEAAHAAATSPHNDLPQPTAAQKLAENYKAGEPITLHGKKIRVENPAGSHRSNFDVAKVEQLAESASSPGIRKSLTRAAESYRAGDVEAAVGFLKAAGVKTLRKDIKELTDSTWANKMPFHYGRILGTKANDGDHRDAFLGPRAADESLPVYVIDIKRKDGSYDESKSMIGYESKDAAVKAFKDSYSPGFGDKLMMGVTEIPGDKFRDWLDDPAYEGKPASDYSQVKTPVSTGEKPKKSIVKAENEKPVETNQGGTNEASASTTEWAKKREPEGYAGIRNLDTNKASVSESETRQLQKLRRPGNNDSSGMVGEFQRVSESRRETPRSVPDSRQNGQQQGIHSRKSSLDDGPTPVSESAQRKASGIPGGKDVFDRLGEETGDSIQNAEAADRRLRLDPRKGAIDPSRQSEKEQRNANPPGEDAASGGMGEGVGAEKGNNTKEGKERLVSRTSAATANQIITDEVAERARARIKEKLGTIRSGIDPELLQDGITLALYHLERGARKFSAYSAAMIDDLGEAVRPYLRSWYEAVRWDPRATGFADDMTPANQIKEGITNKKMVEEQTELAIVKAARSIAETNRDTPQEGYSALVEMYNKQPKLNTRTSTSVEQQAYSTPAPLAYVASRLAGVTSKTTVLEPTAGNGILLIEANPVKVVANELNPDRVQALASQEFEVSQRDAATNLGRYRQQPFDVVLANPPFGVVKDDKGNSKEFDTGFYMTTEIDHAIAFNALKAMKDDGKAVLIVGGINKLARSREARSDAYNGKAKRTFYYYLFQNYNVVDMFTVAGELYERQGAGWPVDVIVIHGKGKSGRALPAVDVPSVYSSWESLTPFLERKYEPSSLGAGNEPTQNISDRSTGQPAVADDAGAVSEPVGQQSTAAAEPVRRPAAGVERVSTPDATGEPATGGQPGAGAKPGRGTAGDGQPTGAATAQLGRRNEVGEGQANPDATGGAVPTGKRERPAGKPAGVAGPTAEPVTQVAYQTQSQGDAIGTLVPVNMQTAITESLQSLEDSVGPLDAFVAQELGFNDEELNKALAAEQVDGVALAIQQLKAGKGFIIGDQCVAGETLIFDPITKAHTPIKELAEAGQPITVLSLAKEGMVRATASAPFKKGIAPLFKVTMEDGNSITVTQGHRFLTPAGWACLRDGLSVGDLLAISEQANNLLSDDETYAQSEKKITADSTDHYSACFDPCDVQLRHHEAGAQVRPPLQQPPRIRSHPCLRADDLAASAMRNHRPAFFRLSTNDVGLLKHLSSALCEVPWPSLPSGALVQIHQALAPSEPSQALPHRPAPESFSDQDTASLPQPSSEGGCHLPIDASLLGHRRCAGLHKHALTTHAPGSVAQAQSPRWPEWVSGISAFWVPIKSIEFARVGEFYDMTVPITSNYFGNSFLSHNTGIGKGRVVASLIRWAGRNGFIPILVTEKPNLYGDMIRDLRDIGHDDVRPFMTNTDLSIDLSDIGAQSLKTPGKTKQENAMAKMRDEADLIDHNMVFTTYSQMQTVKGASTPRMDFLSAIAPRAVFIFDESHNAGGQKAGRDDKKAGVEAGEATGRAGFARKMVAAAAGAAYSSATYAKRPDVMDLYAKTDMMAAVGGDAGKLAEVFARGGVPLQQVAAAMLAKSGQYIRRERSFDGVEYTTEPVAVDQKATEDLSKIMYGIYQFDELKAGAVDELAERAKSGAEKIEDDSATGQAGAQSTNFTSLMHNVIAQMLLALKVDKAADIAIESLKAGEKPVLTLANTMGSFIDSYVSEVGILPGDAIALSFGDVMRRYLKASKRVTVKRPDGSREVRELTDDELGARAVAQYKAVEGMIDNATTLETLPASPVDWLHKKLREAGYKTGEITGRTEVIEYGPHGAIYRRRSSADVSPNGRRAIITGFNSGEIDVVILNQAGSTGLSLHASEKVKNRSRRHMIIVQAEANIDTHMQMLGRVHRTGQVIAPKYSQMAADIPAERRPAAVLAKKMASLNANTTAARSSNFTAKETVDFMNQYGDQAVAQLMYDMPEVHQMLGEPLPKADKGDGYKIEDAARKVTGRIPMLPLAKQVDIYDTIIQEYEAIVARADAMGENALEAKTIDLDAKTVKTFPLTPATGASPFMQAATAEVASVKRQGKPLTGAQVVETLSEKLGAEGQQTLPALRRLGIQKWAEQRKVVADEYDGYFLHLEKQAADDGSSDKVLKSRQTLADAQKARWESVASAIAPGVSVMVSTPNGASYIGVITDIKRRKGVKNPVAAGAWNVHLVVNDGVRNLSVPMSKIVLRTNDAVKAEEGPSMVSMSPLSASRDVLKEFDENQDIGREERTIVTGNLLAGIGSVQGGQLINFTRDDGSVAQGLMMPKAFKLQDHISDQAIEFTHPQVIKFLQAERNGMVHGSDKNLTIVNAAGNFMIRVPKSKATGGQYFLDPALRRAAADDFVSRAGNMTVVVSRDQLLDVLKVLHEQFGQRFYTSAHKDTARAVGGKSQTEQAQVSDIKTNLAEEGRKRLVTQAEFHHEYPLDRLVSHVNEIASRWKGSNTKVYVHDTLDTLPTEVRREMVRRGTYTQRLLGLVHKGDIHLIRTNIASIQEFETVLFHEVEGHLSLMQLLGPGLDKFLRGVALAMPARVRQKGTEYGFYDNAGKPTKAVKFDADRALRQSADELLAEIAETVNSNSTPQVRNLWARFVQWFRQSLRELGWKNLELTEDEIRGWVLKAQHEITKPENKPKVEPTVGNGWIATAVHPNAIPTAGGQPWAAPVTGKQIGVGKKKIDQDSFLYEWQDKHIDTKRVVQAIEAINNRQVEDAKDPYLAEELYHQRTAYRVKNFLNDELKPLLEKAKRLSVSVDELEHYLWARHAEERNITIAQRNSQMPDGGSGMLTADARAYLAGLSPAKQHNLTALAADVDTMIGKTRQTLVGYGLESATTMAMRQAAWPTYVPLHRADYENDAAYGIGQGFSVKGPDSKAALGSSQQVVNILAEIAKQREQAVVRGEKNRVSMALFGLAKANPNLQWWSTTRLPRRRWLDKATNTVRSMVDPNWKNKPNVVVVRFPNKKGRIVERAVIFNEKNQRAMRMAESLKNLDAIQLEGAMGVAASVSRYISSVNTQYNPLFGLFNLWRDVQEGMLNLTTTEIKGQQVKVAKYAGQAIRGIYQDARATRKGQHPTSSFARWFEEMEAEGGTTGYRDLFSTSAERAQSILDEFKQIDENAAKKSIRAIGHWLTDYNLVMESAVRVAAYRTARESGLSKARSASIAKNITINFNRKGRKGQQANALYSFFNARVQGVARSMDTWAGPAGKAIIAGGLLLGAMQAIALAMAGYDDEDPPEFVKQQNFIIPISGGKYLMWNMPQSMRFLISMGRIPTEAMLRESKSAGDAFMDMFATVLDAFNPTGTSTVAQTLAPTAIDPAIALLENKEWTGSSIYQEKMDPMDPTPGFARSKNTASSIGKVTARAINYLSGGTDYVEGMMSPTPDQIDYLLAQATGGVGRELSKSEQTVTALSTGQDLPSYKIPLLGKLYGTTTGRSSERDKFYELAREGRRHMAELEGRGSEARVDRFAAQERVDEYLKEHPEYRGAVMAVKAARNVSEIRSDKRKAAAQGATQAELNAYDDRAADIISKTMTRNKELRQEAH